MLAEQKRINMEQNLVNEEQRRINEELMNTMKQMQAQIIRLSGEDGSGMMGSGYGDNFGGGKMGQSFLGGRSLPYARGPPGMAGSAIDDFFRPGNMVGGSGKGDLGPGVDWYCPKCGNLNYARREQCNMRDCDFEKKDLEGYGPGPGMRFPVMAPGGGPRGPEPRPGDWECPRCNNVNFSHRNRCNGKSNGVSCNLRKPEFEKFGVSRLRSNETRQPGDWACFRCGNLNFPSRENCNKCNIPKEEATNEEAFREDGKGDF